jgi:hypothetical protein
MDSQRNTRSKLARAIAKVCLFEPLENRQLLTTLNGGDVFDYKDMKNDIFRITVRGNTQAEFVGASVDDNTNAVTLGDLARSDAADGSGTDLFAVYVKKANWNSSITVESITIDANTGRVTHRPFTGGIPLTVSNARNGQDLSVNTPQNTGTAYLGARTKSINGQANSQDRPITSAILSGQIGVLPRSSGRLSAGLTVANGQDLGTFLFDGTVTGNVDVGGSMNLFYAGNLLTGETGGAFISSTAQNNNFNIDGDLHDLIVNGSVGTTDDNGVDDPTYLTRFQSHIGGHLGQIHVGDHFVGTVDANDQNKYVVDQDQDEVESRGETASFVNGALNDTLSNRDDEFHNDTFDTAQFVGTVKDGVVVNGTLQAVDRDNFRDWTDYYGVALMAGQTITVQLSDTTDNTDFLDVGVYDPDGRLIATDYSDVDPAALQGKSFVFTADRPGVYRFAVGEEGDADFNGPGGLSLPGHVGTRTYTLDINGAGNLAIGAVSAGGNVFDPEISTDGFSAQRGDIGAIMAGGTAIFEGKAQGNYSIRTDDGDLRALVGDAIGKLTNGEAVAGPDLSIGNGDVGLVQSNTGSLSINPGSMVTPLGGDVPRNYQIVSANGKFEGALIADQKIGVIRAGDMSTLAPSVFVVNADNHGGDGVIDLIDVKGDFGSLLGGGPHITTNAKGNVRYINVGGQLFRDEAFGGGRPDLTMFDPGQTATITDDSGAVLRISAGSTGTLGILTYGIRGSGGSAIVRIETTSGVNVTASSKSSGASAEVAMIRSTGNGPNVISNNGRISLDNTTGTPINVYMNGKSRVDVLNVRGGRFTRIDNNTSGEIVNVLAESVGDLEAESLGIAKSSTGAAILPYDVLIGNLIYPYQQQRTGILVGDVVMAKAYGQVGNFIVNPGLVDSVSQRIDNQVNGMIDVGDNTGSIQSLSADTNNTRSGAIFEGIAAPIYASGAIGDVTIGAGILPSGNGTVARAGLFADGPIGTVRGKKTADIRGNIISGTSIGRIDLANGGSIINSNIMVVRNLQDSREFVIAPSLPPDNDSIDTPTYEIGQINLAGDGKNVKLPKIKAKKPRAPKVINRGGIIGAYLSAPDIGGTTVKGGDFGILNSIWNVPGDGVIKALAAEGYGLRDVQISSGARIGDIIANGNGSTASTALFTTNVRQSESTAMDPYFGFAPNGLTDLHKFLGTNKNNPTITGVTETGVIQGTSAVASRDLGSLQAWKLGWQQERQQPDRLQLRQRHQEDPDQQRSFGCVDHHRQAGLLQSRQRCQEPEHDRRRHDRIDRHRPRL